MADNSIQGGADTIRDLARQAGTVKTQVFQIDAGGTTSNAEILITAGRQTMAQSLPVTLAADQPPVVTQDDDRQYDDDGIPYVNPNVPGADIATGDRQNLILAALQQLLASQGAQGILQSIAAPITVATVNNIPLAANAAVENGNLQRVSDTLELMLTELRVISASITQLGQPIQDGAEQLRNDLTII